jgi:hypothetical protein
MYDHPTILQSESDKESHNEEEPRHKRGPEEADRIPLVGLARCKIATLDHEIRDNDQCCGDCRSHQRDQPASDTLQIDQGCVLLSRNTPLYTRAEISHNCS